MKDKGLRHREVGSTRVLAAKSCATVHLFSFLKRSVLVNTCIPHNIICAFPLLLLLETNRCYLTIPLVKGVYATHFITVQSVLRV